MHTGIYIGVALKLTETPSNFRFLVEIIIGIFCDALYNSMTCSYDSFAQKWYWSVYFLNKRLYSIAKF